ncbi:carboxypeptidase-like regulatory domain-containing protein [Cetobacterium sp.]|uniref:carboxypeptidase-like regulatory domain-containing protein n=1 Tax=Cetobacterium sp. TaxID=2071632 RepID=UPI0025F850C3|nr:carboxypeptidase-like regulatory domain-containing protein [uncultured Cetobacterium sp.]
MRFKLFLCFILVFSLRTFTQNEIVNISGFVTDKEFRLGNATVFFSNSSNVVKTVKSDINGNFSIKLPKNKYRIIVKKEGYTSLIGDDFFVDYIFNEPKQLILNMTDNKIHIYGKIINKFGETIKNADVKIKVGENLIDLKSNSNGEFSFEGQIGLVSIFAQKDGFYGNGTSMLIQNEKFINDISITLEAKTFYISGALVKNNNYLKDTYLELINGSNNKVISTIKTTKDGLFEFRDILTYEKAYFRIPNLGYKSEIFTINKDLRQFNIFTD